MGITVVGGGGEPEHGARPRHGGAEGARALHVDDGARCASAPETGAPVGDLLDELLRETGYYDALAGRADDRGAGPDREPRGARARRARVRRAGRAGPSVGEFLQQIALIADVDSLRDDEGLVTLMTLHNAKGLEFPIVFMIGMEDGVFPHSPRDRRGRASRRSAGSPTSASRARCATSRSPTPAAATRSAPARSACARASSTRSRASSPTSRTSSAVGAGWAPGRVASWSNAAAATAEAPARHRRARVFRLGDDVVHAAFGEGVVTGTEPGGIVVVRFAGDGSERKLMADYAPIKKR